MKKTVYIIGPTTNRSQLNIADFRVIETFLEREGYQSVKPHDLFDESDNNILSQKEQMERRLEAIDKCDLVITMPDWHQCSYARAEHHHARTMQMMVVRFEEWRKVMAQRAEAAFIASITDKRGIVRIGKVA